MKKLNEQSADRPASGVFYQAPERLRMMSQENLDFWWTLKFPSVIVTIKLYKDRTNIAPGSVYHKGQRLNISLKMWRYLNYCLIAIEAFMAFIPTTCHRLYLHWCILNAFSLYFVLSSHTRKSVWTVTETQTRNIFIYIFLNITENKVDLRVFPSKRWAKYSRFLYNGYTGEMAFSTRRGRQRDDELRWFESSRADARLSKFTSVAL